MNATVVILLILSEPFARLCGFFAFFAVWFFALLIFNRKERKVLAKERKD